jgi:acid phosphatase type 7
MQSVNTVIRSNRLRWLGVALATATVLWACGGGGNSPDSTTPPQLQLNATTSWELMTAGDIADCRLRPSGDSDAFKTGQLVKRQLADAGDNSNVLTLGDNAYFLGLSIGYEECYQKTWGDFLPKTFAMPGNHDYESSGENNYFRYFGAKASPPGAGPANSGYYRIDQNGWTLFVLSSVVDATAVSAQGQWLKKELATAKPCVAAAWHHPVFSSAQDGDGAGMAELYAMLDTAKADIVLQSHAHHYERFAPMTSTGEQIPGAGMPSFVVGTGGAKLEGFARQRAGSQKQVQAFGIMRLTLDPGKVAWRFVDIKDEVLDQGNITCRNKA